jgi:hypothetical protein
MTFATREPLWLGAHVGQRDDGGVSSMRRGDGRAAVLTGGGDDAADSGKGGN